MDDSKHARRSAEPRVVISRDISTPIHAQISDDIREHIASGDWPAHYRLMTEPDLAAEYGVSRATLRRGLATLIEEGLLRQVRGKGTFVTPTTIEPAIAQKLTTLSEDFATAGIKATTTVLSCSLMEPSKPVAALLEVPVGGRLMELVRVRSSERGPVALLYNYVRTDYAPGIEKVDFETQSLFGVLEGHFGLKITSARRTFSAESANAKVAEALGLSVGEPVQYLQQVTYLKDHPLEYSDVWIHSGRLKVTSLLSRR